MSAAVLPLAQKPDLFDLYFEYTKNTEATTIHHRWSMVGCLSALLGRQVWLPFGEFRIFPNQYIMLIGESGARKSTAIKMAKKVLSAHGYKNFSAEKTTKEKFLLDLEGLEEASDAEVANTQVMQNLGLGDIHASEPKEVFIVADEFNDFMRTGDTEFHSMLGALWDWDDETKGYTQRLKNSKSVSIYQPTINLLGGNTHVGFADMFPPASLGQGILSRMLLIFAEPSGRKIAFPEPADAAIRAQLSGLLTQIKEKIQGPMKMTDKAKDMMQTIYNSYSGVTDIRFNSYNTRRYTHLWKMCILVAAARLKMEVGVAEVLYANTVLAYAEHFMPRALGEFGKSKNSEVAGKILQVLEKAGHALTVDQLWEQVQSDLDKMQDLALLLEGLRQADKIQYVKELRAFIPKRKVLSTKEVYVDYNLLREFKTVKLGN
jgi:hypothetical protein